MKAPHPAENTYEDVLKQTYFEVCEALQDGRFAQWPASVQKACITVQSDVGGVNKYSALHFAAREGLLNQVTPEILNEDLLLTANSYGYSPLQIAAHLGHLHQVPFQISDKSLQKLLENPETPKESKKWLQRELQKKTLQKALQNSTHPDL